MKAFTVLHVQPVGCAIDRYQVTIEVKTVSADDLVRAARQMVHAGLMADLLQRAVDQLQRAPFLPADARALRDEAVMLLDRVKGV